MIRGQLDLDLSGEAAAVLAYLDEHPETRARVQAVLAPERPALDLAAEPGAAEVLRYLSARPELAREVVRATPIELRAGGEWTWDPRANHGKPWRPVRWALNGRGEVLELWQSDTNVGIYGWHMPFGGVTGEAIGGWVRADYPRHAMLLLDAFARSRGFTLIGEPPLRTEPCRVCDGTGTVREDKRLPASMGDGSCWGCRGALRLPVPHEQDEPVGTLEVTT